MALQIWLPLNGTLENKGCADITAVNNGATVNTAGKIGSCYSFDGSNDSLLGTPAVLNNSSPEWSFACWFKPTNSHQGCLFSNRTRVDTTGIAIFYYQNQMIIDDGSRWQFTPSQAISVGEWNHITVTKNQQNKKFYLNGVLVNSTTSVGTPTIANATAFSIGASQQSSTVASGNQLNGQLNDVRIYDNCLSAAEVHEISQGLVLHYKLDSIAMDGKTIVDSSGYSHHGTIKNTVTVVEDSPRYFHSIYLPNANSMINCGRGGMVTDSITINIWNNYESNGQPLSCTQSGGWNFPLNPMKFQIYINGFGYGTQPNSSYTPTLGEWFMMTAVYDRINQKKQIYINGRLAGEVAGEGNSGLIMYHSSNVIWIGAEATTSSTSGTNGMIGKFSDFRIYCTALSAEDILDLYHTSAKIDKTGKVHTFELVEDTGTKVTKTGIVEGTRFFQNGYVFKEGGSIVNFKPGEGVKNSCSSNIKIEFTDVADFSSPIAITIDFDFTWTDFAFQSEPAGSVLLQAQGTNRLRSDGTWKWQGRNCITANVSALLRNAVNSATSGSQHITVTDTITAEWFETYDASNFSFRCDYSDGNGTLTVTNFKVTLGKDIAKFNSQYISANEFIEK